VTDGGGAETSHIAAPVPSRSNAAQNGERQGVVPPWGLCDLPIIVWGKGEY
jgi:hypothetical protein